jgi:hypothetical protein
VEKEREDLIKRDVEINYFTVVPLEQSSLLSVFLSIYG